MENNDNVVSTVTETEVTKYDSKAKKQQLKNMPNAEKVQYYQKKLVPLNIVICILSLISALSLIFLPFLKIDLGKIISSEGVKNTIVDSISDSIGGDEADASSSTPFASNGNVSQDGGSSSSEIDLSGVAVPVITSFLDQLASADLSISFSTFDSLKISSNGTSELKKIITDKVGDMTENLVDTIADTLETEDVKTAISDTVVDTLSSTVIDSLTDGMSETQKEAIKDKEEDIKTTVNKINTVKSADEMREVANEFTNLLEEITGETLSTEDKVQVADEMAKLYTDTMDKVIAAGKQGEVEFSIETVICVMLSENISSDQLTELLGGIGGDNSSDDPDNGVEPESAKVPFVAVLEDGGSNSTGEIYFTYGEYVASLDGVTDEMVDSVKAEMDKILDEASATLDEVAVYYGYVGYAMLAFAGIWAILFLFALGHIFTKNKRVNMWYVKVLCWLPCLLWLILALVGGDLLWSIIGEATLGAEFVETLPLVKGIVSGIKSFTWVSGLCLVLLYGISLFWAFPIKHKIRKAKKALKKERKLAKRAQNA